ncbi:hypothetical protein RDWZM_005364, partial [Blomia tropicalis]
KAKNSLFAVTEILKLYYFTAIIEFCLPIVYVQSGFADRPTSVGIKSEKPKIDAK